MKAHAALVLALAASAPRAAPDSLYETDVAFALDALEQECGELLRVKDVDWKQVRKEFTQLAKDVETAEEHRVLLKRLLARVRDGHAEVLLLEEGKEVGWPPELVERGESLTGPGMFWCRSGGKIYVKDAWNAAADVGIEPGMEVVKVDGVAVAKWIDARTRALSNMISFSTPQQAFLYTCHGGSPSRAARGSSSS